MLDTDRRMEVLDETAPLVPAALPAPPAGARLPAVLPPITSDPGEASVGALELARALGLSITVADVLHRGGHLADDDTRRFLAPKLAHLTPPDGMADREASADRIARAIRAGERVCVFGDYDCDGITATAIMTGVIRALGGEAVPLL